MSEDRETPPKGRMPREQRERQLIATAENVFSRRGFEASSMEEIAREAGVDRALLYQYFGGKRGIYEACVNAALEDLQERVMKAISGIEDASTDEARRAVSIAGVRVFFEFVQDHSAGWDVLFGAGWSVNPGDGPKPELDILQFIVGIISIQYGGASAEKLRATAAALIGASWAVSLWWRSQDVMSLEEITAHHVDFCLATLEPLRPRAAGE